MADVEITKEYTSNLVIHNLMGKDKIYKNKETIAPYEFASKKRIKHIEFPDCLESIYKGAFNNCTSLEEVKIDHAIKIGAKAFYACSKLKAIDIDTSCIPTECFYMAGNQLGIDVNLKNTRSIGPYAFFNVMFKSLNLPDTLEEIDNSAFKFTSFKLMDYKLVLPKNVKYIENYAFASTTVNDIYLPSGIEFIGNLADFERINIHVSKKTAEKLGLSEEQDNVIIDSLDIVVEDLLNKIPFKKVNEIMLNSEINK